MRIISLLSTAAALRLPGADLLGELSNALDLNIGGDSGAVDDITSGLPLIASEALQDLITEEPLHEWAERLFDAANESAALMGHATRLIGTPGHKATLKLITDTLDELSDYYTYTEQPFTVTANRVRNWTLEGPNGTIQSQPLRMTPAILPQKAPIHFINSHGCLPSDYSRGRGSHADDSCEGRVLVVQRGGCPFGDKSEIAGMAGALGVLVWDPEAKDADEVLANADLGDRLPHQVGTLGISARTAAELQEGDLVGVSIDAELMTVDTVNIIAETRSGDHDNVVFAGAHSDSVVAGPGLNDNGSGLITLLEVAKQLVKFKVKNAVRFGWWSAEELGLKGSLYYTENLSGREAEKIRLFLDYDMMASPNYKYEIYDSDDSENPLGSSALRDLYIEWYKAHGLNYTLQPFDGRSDYVGFVEIGIPSSGIDAGVEEIKTVEEVAEFGGKAGVAYDECYHLACDTIENLAFEPWLVNSKLVAHSIAVFAKSLDKFPARDNSFYHSRDRQPRKWPGSPLS